MIFNIKLSNIILKCHKWVVIFKLLIREYRKFRKMTQKDLAIHSNVTQPYISDLEKGIIRKKSPTLRTLQCIAKALSICPFLLLTCDQNNDCKKCMYSKDKNFFKYVIRQDVITDIQQQPFFINFYKRWLNVAGQKFTIYMDSSLIKDLKKIAIDKDTSASQIISELVNEYVKREKENRQ